MAQTQETAKVKFASKEYDLDTGDFSITFGNGKVLSANYGEFSDIMKIQLGLHGLGQKAGDSYAGAKGNYDLAYANASEVLSQLRAGEWRSSGDGEARPRLGELSEAIARVKGISLEEATEAVKAAAALEGTDEEKKAGAEKLKVWRAHPKIKAAIARIKADKAEAELAAAGDTAEVSIS